MVPRSECLVFLLMVELPILWDKGALIKVLIWRHFNAYLISLLILMALILLNFYIEQTRSKVCRVDVQVVDQLNNEFLEFVSM